MQEIFGLADVLRITGLPRETLRNWSVGRGVGLRPSLSPARGTGSRNLYSTTDLYALAVAKQMADDGLRAEVIRKVVASRPDFLEKLTTRSALLIANRAAPGRKPQICVEFYGPFPAETVTGIAQDEGLAGYYVLDIERLRQRVDAQVAQLRRKGEL